MPIPFRCPQCGHSTMVDEKYAGQTGPCAKCGTQITVPLVGAANTVGAAPSVGVAPPGYPQTAYPPTGYPQMGYPASPPPAAGGGSWTPVLVVLGVLAGGGLLVILILAALLLPAIGQARQAARRAQSTGHLKQIALGLHNYADSFGMLPYAGAEDREYGLGLSGRVRLLPFLEEGNLHGRVNYDEPWDSPANQFLSSSMPRVYHSPMQPDSRSHSTYLAIVDSVKVRPGDDSWDRKRPQPVFSQDARSTHFSDIVDGTSNTLMYLETDASESVAWESPRNWVFDPLNPRRGLGMTYRKGFNAVFVDGSTRFLDNSVSDETLKNLVLRNDGNVVDLP